MNRFVTLVFIALFSCAVSSAQPPAGGAATKPQPSPAATRTQAVAAVGADACGCEGEPLPEVLATVGATKISRAEVEEVVRSQVEKLQQEVIEARKRELDLQINSLVLEAEAKKRNTTTTKLLEQEVVARAAEPTEAEAQAFFDQNKARIEETAGRGVQFADVKANIIAYMRDERQRETARKLADQLRAAAAVRINQPQATPPAAAADRARVFATVGGRQITSAMIEDSLKPLVFNVQQRVYQLRRNQLDLKINDLLLAQEAQKRQLTPRALLEAEVAAKKRPVTDVEALTFYNENKERINGSFEQIKAQIVQYLEEQQTNKLQTALAERLRAAAGVQDFLREPVSPVFEIATDDQPSKGAATAAVTVVEFTDFQCPSCARAHPVLERLAAEYGDRVRFVVRDYPLAQHADAFKAAEAAEAARELGKYWEYVALLFANQSALGVPQLKEYAGRVGLDRPKFDALLDSGRLAEKVRRDLDDGNRVGVSGTPSIFVNGRRAVSITYEGLKASIDAALKEKGRA